MLARHISWCVFPWRLRIAGVAPQYSLQKQLLTSDFVKPDLINLDPFVPKILKGDYHLYDGVRYSFLRDELEFLAKRNDWE